MRRVAVVAAVVLTGCAAGGEDQAPQPQPRVSDETRIRSWSTALNAGNYEQAAGYFARGAIVEQTQEIRLINREAAIVFNRSLPCRADVTGVKDEGATSLASFRLKRGPGGPCSGRARVRFTIERGKFTEWRQLPEPGDRPAPPGDSA